MSTAFIHAVMEQHPQARVDLIVKAGYEHIPLPHRGQILVYDKKRQSAGLFGFSLKKEGYDRFYILPRSFSSAWMAFCSKVPERIGYRGNFRGALLHPVQSYRYPPRTRHLIQEYLDLLKQPVATATLPINQVLPLLNVSPEWIEIQLDEILEELPENYVALATGAIYGPAKRWPLEYYRALAKQLVDAGLSVLLLGTQADHEDGEKIREGSSSIHNWCGKTSLSELIALLARARLLICNDSGSMHIMTALQRPLIAIFGSTSPTWTGPLNVKARVIYQDLDCSPCFQRQCRFGHYHCLRYITPGEIFQNAHHLLRTEDCKSKKFAVVHQKYL